MRNEHNLSGSQCLRSVCASHITIMSHQMTFADAKQRFSNRVASTFLSPGYPARARSLARGMWLASRHSSPTSLRHSFLSELFLKTAIAFTASTQHGNAPGREEYLASYDASQASKAQPNPRPTTIPASTLSPPDKRFTVRSTAARRDLCVS